MQSTIHGAALRWTMLESAQWAVLVVSGVVAGVAAFVVRGGRERYLGRVVTVGVVVAGLGTALFWLGEVLAPPAGALPVCDFSDLDDDLRPACETAEEAMARAAGESREHLVSSYVLGPLLEGAVVSVGALVGVVAAGVTGPRPRRGAPSA